MHSLGDRDAGLSLIAPACQDYQSRSVSQRACWLFKSSTRTKLGELYYLEQVANEEPSIGTPFRSELEDQLAQLKVSTSNGRPYAFCTLSSRRDAILLNPCL